MVTKTEYTLESFIGDVLNKTFPNNRFKQHINDDDDKLNFACPYCGDSQNDVTKKRGNIFYKTGTYKCFNDGCLKFTKINDFVSTFAQKFHLSIPSMVDVEPARKIQTGTKRGELLLFLMKQEVKDILIDFEYLAERFFLTPCINAPRDSKIWQYVNGRNITHLPAFEKSCYFDSRQDKLYIFNLDLRSGKVLGLSIRRIDPDWTGPRYDIKNYSQFVKNKLIDPVDDKIIAKIDLINGYFNILNIKFSQPIIILEGQIDAMFLDNSIATAGVTKSKTILSTLVSKKNARILFDNDDAGRDETIKLINEGYSVFLWSKLISELRKKYPHHRRELNEVKDINNLYNFYADIGENHTHVSFNKLIMQYFSDSVFDLISI
jgi:hypothetical protein